MEKLGAGEILLTSIDQEGTQRGFDLPLIQKVSRSVNIPVIASGGMGSLSDFDKCVNEARGDAVAIAHMLHYKKVSVAEVKSYAAEQGLPVRR